MNNKSTIYGKRNIILSYLILLSIGTSTYFIHSELSVLRSDIKHAVDIPKIKITDNIQFSSMCAQFTEQWGGKYYAFYILQPNSNFKTYKEKATVSKEISNLLPNRTPITTSKLNSMLDGIDCANINANELDDILLGNQLHDSLHTVVITIKQNNIVVGELYVFYDDIVDMKTIEANAIEAQLLTQLLY